MHYYWCVSTGMLPQTHDLWYQVRYKEIYQAAIDFLFNKECNRHFSWQAVQWSTWLL